MTLAACAAAFQLGQLVCWTPGSRAARSMSSLAAYGLFSDTRAALRFAAVSPTIRASSPPPPPPPPPLRQSLAIVSGCVPLPGLTHLSSGGNDARSASADVNERLVDCGEAVARTAGAACTAAARDSVEALAVDTPGYEIWSLERSVRMLGRSKGPEAQHMAATSEFACPRVLVQYLEESAAAGRAEVLLDIGAGAGGCTLPALLLGHSVVAVEAAAEAAAAWRANVAANAALIPTSARAVLLPLAVGEVAAARARLLTLGGDLESAVVEEVAAAESAATADGGGDGPFVCVITLDSAAGTFASSPQPPPRDDDDSVAMHAAKLAIAPASPAALLPLVTVLRLSTNGGELRALRGARGLLSRLSAEGGPLQRGWVSVGAEKLLQASAGVGNGGDNGNDADRLLAAGFTATAATVAANLLAATTEVGLYLSESFGAPMPLEALRDAMATRPHLDLDLLRTGFTALPARIRLGPATGVQPPGCAPLLGSAVSGLLECAGVHSGGCEPVIAAHRTAMPADVAESGSGRPLYSLWPVEGGRLRVLARADPKEAIARHLSGGQLVCPEGLLSELRESAERGRHETLLDVGSNVGSCSLAALALGHTAIALEPSPENVRLWRANVLLNEAAFPASARAFLLPYAAADAVGAGRLRHDGTNTGNAMVEEPSAGPGFGLVLANAATGGRDDICLIALDDVAAGGDADSAAHADLRSSLAAVTLIKIDVQGHEAKAARGMRRMLAAAAHARRAYIEVTPAVAALKGDDAMDVFHAFDQAGFIFAIAGSQQATADDMRTLFAAFADNPLAFVDIEAHRESALEPRTHS